MGRDPAQNPESTIDTGPPFEPITVRIPAAIKLTGIGRSKLYELIGEGALDVVKVGSSTLITVESIRRMLAARRV